MVIRCAQSCRAQLSPIASTDGTLFTAEDVEVLARELAPGKREFLVMLVCAWCGRELGLKEGYTHAGVSHGVCPDCAQRLMREYELDRALVG